MGWEEYSGTIPRPLAGLNETPVLYDGAWWARQGTSVIRHPAAGVGAVGLGSVDVNDPTVQAAAMAMNDALLQRGYKVADQGLYRAFQQAAGLTADGFPGTVTMNALHAVLSAVGSISGDATQSLPIYAWKAEPGITGYDGVNAPLWSDWAPGQAAPANGQSAGGATNNSFFSFLSTWPSWAIWVVGGALVGGAGLVAWALVSKPSSKELRHHAKGEHKAAVHHMSHYRKLHKAAEAAEARESPRRRRRKARRSRRRGRR